MAVVEVLTAAGYFHIHCKPFSGGDSPYGIHTIKVSKRHCCCMPRGEEERKGSNFYISNKYMDEMKISRERVKYHFHSYPQHIHAT